MQLQLLTVSTNVNSLEDDACTMIRAPRTIAIVKRIFIHFITDEKRDRTTSLRSSYTLQIRGWKAVEDQTCLCRFRRASYLIGLCIRGPDPGSACAQRRFRIRSRTAGEGIQEIQGFPPDPRSFE